MDISLLGATGASCACSTGIADVAKAGVSLTGSSTDIADVATADVATAGVSLPGASTSLLMYLKRG